MDDLRKHINTLIKRAAEEHSPDGAMKLAQAALNAANAACSLNVAEGKSG